MKRYLVVFGARPSAVKLGPVIHALESRGAEVDICLTGQHGQMLDVCLDSLDMSHIKDLQYRLTSGVSSDSLSARLGGMIRGVEQVISEHQYTAVIVVGDTISGLAGAIAGAFADVPVAHVEAGLRTYCREPWPEEMTRRQIDVLAHWHFAPTDKAQGNLRSERLPTDNTWLVGNTLVDSLRKLGVERKRPDSTRVLVTLHRRENWPRMTWLAAAIKRLALSHPEAQFLWPLHPNSTVSRPVVHACASQPNVALLPALAYPDFLASLATVSLVITDSGGVQEESATLGVPSLIVRDVTERPEAVVAGVSRLVGSDLIRVADGLLSDPAKLAEMEGPTDCFGDGHAGERIADILLTGKNDLGSFFPEDDS